MEVKTYDKLLMLRDLLKRENIQFVIVPTSDPHLSEYVADHWKCREWLSGFTGSAGTIVVAEQEAGLWTDSRYFLQAEEQLAHSGIELFREGLPETPSLIEWIGQKAKSGDTVGIDGERFSVGEVENLRQTLGEKGIKLATDATLVSHLWKDAPALPKSDIFYLDEKYSGKGLSEKLDLIRHEIRQSESDTLLITALDEVAWAFNLRASDVEFNPVAIAFALVSEASATIFTDGSRIRPEALHRLNEANVVIEPYLNIYSALKSLPAEKRILMDKCKTNHSLFAAIDNKERIRFAPSPITKMKSVKNETEIEGIRKAVVKDGVAMAQAFRWLEESVTSGKRVTELGFAEKLRECRSLQEGFFCESFGTIAGYGKHGAIVHYSATEESDAEIGTDSLLLVDSGANYFDGTTDITRTIILGTPTAQQRRDYTNVLKGHIALATIQFPQGTHGAQLDVLARQFLWNEGEDYGHGTGHGIGHFLCVHEGPQNIRTRDNGTALQKGMLTSNEPGLYKTGLYGIRTENIVLVQEGERNGEFGQFLRFETVSLFPFDTKLIEPTLLSEKERTWINQYHQRVYEKIAPLTDEETRLWLAEKVKTI